MYVLFWKDLFFRFPVMFLFVRCLRNVIWLAMFWFYLSPVQYGSNKIHTLLVYNTKFKKPVSYKGCSKSLCKTISKSLVFLRCHYLTQTNQEITISLSSKYIWVISFYCNCIDYFYNSKLYWCSRTFGDINQCQIFMHKPFV